MNIAATFPSPPRRLPITQAPSQKRDVDELLHRRTEFLRAYQSDSYAEFYRDWVTQVRLAELCRVPAAIGLPLTHAVACGLFRLMACKDGYEVARLCACPRFRQQLERRSARKLPALFPALAWLKFLRGSPFDPFRRSEARRGERAVFEEYRTRVQALLAGLCARNHALAVEIAAVAQGIRGSGQTRAANMRRAREAWLELEGRAPAQASPPSCSV